jgi:hypothetical protein
MKRETNRYVDQWIVVVNIDRELISSIVLYNVTFILDDSSSY